jgi:UDP-N-acetylmuramyl tripeptide synthase
MALPYLIDSRRLTGPSLLLGRPGAIIEVEPPSEICGKLITLWRRYLRGLHQRLGWQREEIATRRMGRNAMLAASAPIDLLMLASYLNEWSWEAALAHLAGERFESLPEAAERYARRLKRQQNLPLRRLYRQAWRRKVQVQVGDDISLGEGARAQVWSFDDAPEPATLDFAQYRHWVPTALVTGTNGKTTTTRMLARILNQAGYTAGFCSTDVIQVGDSVVDRDDYSGPGGARAVLRHPDTTAAVLETARGGLLRRGLQARLADVGIVTNVGEDHLGDLGIHTIEQLAEVKFLIRLGLARNAPMVVNAEDIHCRRHARRLTGPVIWFAPDPPSQAVLRGTRRPYGLATVRAGRLCFERLRKRVDLLAVTDIPACHGGSARHNIANALAAAAAALAMGVSAEHIATALSRFGADPADNPGRANLFSINGASVLMDFGHNPEGLRAVFEIARKVPRQRLLISFGQAGDRTDEAIRELSDVIAAEQPDRVLIKQMPKYARGRDLNEVPKLLVDRLLECGLPEERIEVVAGEHEAVADALAWLQPGDLAVLFVHGYIEQINAELAALAQG